MLQLSEWSRGSNRVSVPNFVAIGPTVAEMWRFLLSRLLRVDLITLEGKCPSVSRYVRPYVRTSVHKKLFRFQ